MNKQNQKIIAIMFAVLMIPSMLFASGSTESDTDSKEYWRYGKRGRFRGKEHGFFGEAMPGMGGVYVTDVAAGSPAEASGLQAGDIILAVNGETSFGLKTDIQELSPGDTVELTIARPRGETDDAILPQELKVSITLGTNDAGETYAGIQFLSRFGGGGRGYFWSADPEDLEKFEGLRQEFLEYLEKEGKDLDNNSL